MQLVLLDHGLYRDVPDTVRLNYCRLWKGIVLGDAAEVRRASDARIISYLYVGKSKSCMEQIQRASDALGVVSPHMEGIRSGKNLTQPGGFVRILSLL